MVPNQYQQLFVLVFERGVFSLHELNGMLCFKERGVHDPGFAVEAYDFFADDVKTLSGAGLGVAIIESASNLVAFSSLLHDGRCHGKAGRPLRAFGRTRANPGRSAPDDRSLRRRTAFGSVWQIVVERWAFFPPYPLHDAVGLQFQAFGARW